MKLLRPLILTDALYAPIEKIIRQIFEDMIFNPLRAALREAGLQELTNAKSLALEKALVQGTLYYQDGVIYGKFNSTISKELRGLGARFNRHTNSWKLPEGVALPARLQIAVAQAEDKADKAIGSVLHVLDGINPNDYVDKEQLEEQYGTAAWRINENFLETAAQIAVIPEFTEAAKKIIAREWATNLELYIKNWTDEAIVDLRQKVQANTLRGQRSANLIKTIQDTYGASKAKAKFLARQETSLLMSKMREQRYKEIGSEKYIWRGVNDARERPDHKMLNGTVQLWSSPPITDRITGARNHPGEDFNCRCIAVPVVEE